MTEESNPNSKSKLVTLKLDRDVYSKLQKYVLKGNRGSGGIRKFVNDTLEMYVQMSIIKEHIDNPFLKLVNVLDNSIYIKDTKINKVVEVRFTYNAPKINVECMQDKTDFNWFLDGEFKELRCIEKLPLRYDSGDGNNKININNNNE